MVEHHERFENFKPTPWFEVMGLLRRDIKCREKVYYPTGRSRFFCLGNMLGVGKSGAVYKARFGEITCCLKFVPLSSELSTEAALADKQVASMISHPCLVHYYSTFLTSDAFASCMEYIKGIDLSLLLLMAGSGLPTEMVPLVVSQLGLAVQYLHFKGFIHRDIKPSNIMILSGSRIKLIDFDTCKISMGKYSRKPIPAFDEKTSYEFPLSEPVGTVYYWPPEVFNRTGLGRSTDWWAIGVSAFEIATGLKPFWGDDDQVAYQITSGIYSWPPELIWDENLVRFVSDCLTIDTAARLCSEKYSDFQRHPYFTNVDFQWVQTAPILHDYPLIDEILGQKYAHHSDYVFPPSPQSEAQRALLFPTMTLQDLDDQEAIYCYSSPGFIRCLKAYENDENPTEVNIFDVEELLEVEDVIGVPYVFSVFREKLTDSQPPTPESDEDTSERIAHIAKECDAFKTIDTVLERVQRLIDSSEVVKQSSSPPASEASEESDSSGRRTKPKNRRKRNTENIKSREHSDPYPISSLSWWTPESKLPMPRVARQVFARAFLEQDRRLS